jgi:hypothetical protein
MRKNIFIIMIIGLLCQTSQFALAQISEGGTPMSFSSDIDVRGEAV